MKSSATISPVRKRLSSVGKRQGQPGLDTRHRILDVTLELLNEGGPKDITTAAIATRASISEGNLHYHFSRKEQIVGALFDRFTTELLATSTAPVGDPEHVEAYLDYQVGWFRLMWRYRCFYRDRWALQSMAPDLGPRRRAIEDEAEQRFRAYVVALNDNGFLQATSAQIDAIVTNTWIVSSYWMDFVRCRSPRAEIGHAELARGFALIMSLYEPYLTDKGRSLSAGETPDRRLARLDG